VAKNNTTFRLKDVKELTYAAFGKNTKYVWTKGEEHVVKIEKEYCKENCIDRSVIEPIIIVLTFHEYKARFVFGFRLDYKMSLFIFFLFCIKLFCALFMCYNQSKLKIPVLDKHFKVEKVKYIFPNF
jgi:hypothetical protein